MDQANSLGTEGKGLFFATISGNLELADGTQAYVGLEVIAKASARSGNYAQGERGRIVATAPELKVQWPRGLHSTYPKNIIAAPSAVEAAQQTCAAISVGTANVWFNQGSVATRSGGPLQAIRAFLETIPLDVLLFQESKDVDIGSLPGYQVVYNEGCLQRSGEYREHEKMGCILKSSSPWEVALCSPYETQLAKSGIVRRNRNTQFRLKADHSVRCSVANVHLCGGEVDERFAQQETNLERLRWTKNEMLEALISAGADIIAGDFNSDRTNSNADFLRGRVWTDAQIQIWNHAPNERLTQAGYTLVPNGKPTSAFGGIPDMMWHLPHRTRPVSSHSGKIAMLRDGRAWASDHDGLYALFQVAS
jgi:hypothetical protein